MRRIIARTVLVLAASVTVATGTIGTANAAPVAGGSTTITTSTALGRTLLKAGVIAFPANGATGTVVTVNPPVFTATFPVSGGDVDLAQFIGSVEHRGELVFANVVKGRVLTLNAVQVNLIDFTISTRVKGTDVDVPTFTLGDVAIDAAAGTLTAADVRLTAEAATALNSALSTRVFTAGLLIGSVSTSVTFAPSAV